MNHIFPNHVIVLDEMALAGDLATSPGPTAHRISIGSAVLFIASGAYP